MIANGPAVPGTQILDEWSTRLAASLQNLTGVKPTVQWAGSSDGAGDRTVLWLEFVAGPATRVHVGASESSWRGLAARVISSNPAVEAYLDAQQIYINLLEQSSELKGTRSAHAPPCARFEVMELRFPSQQPVQLLLCARDIGAARPEAAFGVLSDVEMPITIRFGSTQMFLQDLVGLDIGSTVEFDRAMDETVEILVNGRLVAQGDAVIVRGNYGVRITEVVSREERLNTSFAAVQGKNTTQNIQKEAI